MSKTIGPVKLGDEVKDLYTGYRGVAMARTEWLYSCARILIKPTKLDNDGKPQEGDWFDETQVKVVKRLKPKVSPQVIVDDQANGGPQNDPKGPR